MENDKEKESSKQKETSILLQLLMTNISYGVTNQNYLLMILEDLAELRAKQNQTNEKDEVAKIATRLKAKELSSTLVLAQNMAKLMSPDMNGDIDKIMDILKSKNN